MNQLFLSIKILELCLLQSYLSDNYMFSIDSSFRKQFDNIDLQIRL